MAGNIKGITIEFRGDTTRLDKALRQVNNETRSIDKELRNVNNALKFNPTSVELWRQKQELLSKKISETKDKLSLLKQQQQAMDAAGVDKQSLEYQKLQREIIETESKLKTFEGQLRKVGNVNLKAASEQFKQWGTTLENAGRQMQGLSIAAGALVASLGAISYKAGQGADEINTLSKVTGIGTAELQKYSYAADLVDVSTEDVAKANQRLKRSAYAAANGSKAQAEAFEAIGVSVTNADGSLRDSEDIFQDVISSLGSMTNETERDALAQKLMGKTAANLNPLIADQGETYKKVSDTLKEYDLDFVDQETLDKANEFNDQLDTMKLIGSVAIAQVGSQLAAFLVPALEKIVGWIGKLAGWLSKLSPQVLTIIGIVAGVVAAVAPVLIILGKLSFAISSLLNLANLLGVGIGALAGPIGIAIAAIVAIIAIGVLLYKNWDTIKAKMLQLKNYIATQWNNLKRSVINTVTGLKNSVVNLWTSIKSRVSSVVSSIRSTLSSAWSTIRSTASSAWQSIKEAIISPIQTAKDTVSGILDTIKGFFPLHIGDVFSGLRLPHFRITSSGSFPWGIGGKGSMPSWTVDWYKTGGIFDGPTVIGVGEAGAEAVVPLDRFWDEIGKLQTSGPNIVININGASKDPREIAEEVKRVLIQETNRRRLAWQ